MSEKLENLFDLVTAGEWGSNQGATGGIDTGVIRSANFTKDHKFNSKEIVVRSIEERKRQRKLLRHGDILIEKSGGSPDQPVGRVLFYDLGGEHTCSNFISILRPSLRADPKFLYYSLCNLYERGTVKNYQQQTTGIINLQLAEYLQESIFLPPLPEQKKIAEILSGIDTAVKHLRRHLGKQDVLKKSLLNTLIFNSSNPGDPGNGNYHCLGEISTRITDGTHQAVKTSEQGTIPFLYVSCVRDGMIDWDKSAFISEEQYAIATQGRQPSPGDILYTAVGSYGNAAMVTTDHRFCFQRHIALIQLNREKAVPKFIELSLSSDQTKRSVDQVVAGNAQPTLTLGELRKLQIPLPPRDGQQQICDIIFPLEKKISALERKIIALSNLKQAISADLLSGRKRVSI
jgi:type I restriction enzyme S subunit